ncbi:MAG: hypothetical protein ACI9BH_001421 [Paracoccaceae bacterium]|jgi:hypothetical protein
MNPLNRFMQKSRENARRALLGNAGIKLYLMPSDEKTIE